jgi:hypothetical protein
VNVFPIKQGDLLPKLRVQLKQDGLPIDLTLASAVTLRLRKAKTTGTLKVNAAMVVVDAVNGIVEYTWQGTDTDTVATYDAEVSITYVNGPRTVPSNGYFGVVVGAVLA